MVTQEQQAPASLGVNVRSATATVHRYYVEVIDEIECMGTPRYGSEKCDNEWWKYTGDRYKTIMDHVANLGHVVNFKITDYCSAEPAGNVLAPDAADFLKLRQGRAGA